VHCVLPDVLRFEPTVEFQGRFFLKVATVKFQEISTGGNRHDAVGQTVGKADTTKLIGAFRELGERSKNCAFSVTELSGFCESRDLSHRHPQHWRRWFLSPVRARQHCSEAKCFVILNVS
jgi:hypothetical protein